MSGSGTTEQTIIDILTHRTYEQRNEIADVFNKKYGHELKFRDWLSDEVGGVFGEIINDLMYPPTHTLANHLLWAMKGPATNEQTLIDILVSMDATEKKEVKTLFKAKAGQSLRSYVSSDTSGNRKSADFMDRISRFFLITVIVN